MSSVNILGRRKISRLGLRKLAVHSPDLNPSGSQTSIMLGPRSDCCTVLGADMSKLESFHNGCRIFWPNKISNRDLYRRTGCQSIVMEIKRRRIRWLGDVHRMDQGCITKVASLWKPPGKRKPGRPKSTWRRTVY